MTLCSVRRRIVALAAAGCLTVSVTGSFTLVHAAPPSPSDPAGQKAGIVPVRWLAHHDARPRPGGGNGISYHGGPVLLGTAHVYYIWYGNWSGSSAAPFSNSQAQTILTAFMGTATAPSFGGSPYYNINTTYYNGAGTHVSNAVTLAGSTTDSYSQGTSFGDAGVYNIVNGAISAGKLPLDLNGVYFVLTSGDVNETSGFLTQYCGWHTHGTIRGQDIKYAFVGDPSRTPKACEAQTSASPNGNTSADGMASVIAHETEETTSDEDLNAWYDAQGNENADKCAWTFGAQATASNGSTYNVVLGGKPYLIQQNWVNASGGYCAMSH